MATLAELSFEIGEGIYFERDENWFWDGLRKEDDITINVFKVRRVREQHTSKDRMKSRSRENRDKLDGFWAMLLLSGIKKNPFKANNTGEKMEYYDSWDKK